MFNKKNLPVKDLDKIVSESKFFKLHGKTHEISPMTSYQFFLFTNSLAEIHEMSNSKNVSIDSFKEKYFNLMKSVTLKKGFFGEYSTIKKSDIDKCTLQQLCALVQFVVSSVMGIEESKGEDILKKK